MKTSQRGFAPLAIILIIVGILVVGGAAYWYWFNVYVPSIQSGGIQTQLAGKVMQASSTTQTTSSDTADWKTYTNKYLGFSIKYPPNWFINDDEESSAIIGNFSYSLNKSSDFPKSGASISLEGTFGGCVDETKGYETNNNIEKVPIEEKVICINNVRMMLAVDASDSQISEKETLLDSIANSFQSFDVISTWKTYTNEQYGFEFKYPPLGTDQEIVITPGSYQGELNELELKTSSKIDPNYCPSGLIISIDSNSNNLSLEDWFSKNMDLTNGALLKSGFFKEFTRSDGVQYLKQMPVPLPSTWEDGPIDVTHIVISKDGKYIFAFSPSYQACPFIGFVDQVFSTFKFTN